MTAKIRIKQWGVAWTTLTVVLGFHVIDEALTGFLPLYNSLVVSLRETFGWVPLPTFSFSQWLAGLVVGIILLLGLSPLVFSGRLYLRPVAYFLGALMTLNALGHIGGSIFLGALAPGTLSSPILLIAAVALLITTRRVGRRTTNNTYAS